MQFVHKTQIYTRENIDEGTNSLIILKQFFTFINTLFSGTMLEDRTREMKVTESLHNHWCFSQEPATSRLPTHFPNIQHNLFSKPATYSFLEIRCIKPTWGELPSPTSPLKLLGPTIASKITRDSPKVNEHFNALLRGGSKALTFSPRMEFRYAVVVNVKTPHLV